MTWKPADSGLIEADVVRWTEAIWGPSRRRKRRLPWGKQQVTGQITALEGDSLSLKIMEAKIVETNIGAELKPHKPGTIIRKKRSTLLKGRPERLLWSDEDARNSALGQLRSGVENDGQ
jgi:hypothetical protein